MQRKWVCKVCSSNNDSYDDTLICSVCGAKHTDEPIRTFNRVLATDKPSTVVPVPPLSKSCQIGRTISKLKESGKKKVGAIITAVAVYLSIAVGILLWKPWVSDEKSINDPVGHRAVSQFSTYVFSTEKEKGTNAATNAESGMSVLSSHNDIHRYEIIALDCSWTEAQQDALRRGGYLACLETQEECEYVVDLINQEAPELSIFRIGMRRDESSTDYYWVDENNQFFGPLLNMGKAWYCKYWHEGEPTFGWNGLQECYGLLQYNENDGRWGWNDSADVLDNSFAGKQGFIVEYEPSGS